MGHQAIVLDPGRAMITAAGSLREVMAVRGTAQQMPFVDQCVDVAYFHLSIHYGDWRRSLDEARRVLRPTGRIIIWTLGPDHHAASMLARWFPSVEAIDRDRFPDPVDVEAHLARTCQVENAGEIERHRRPAGEWAAAVEAGFVSTLQLVPPGELASGLAAFRTHHPDPGVLIEYHMHWTRLVART
jgi:SAM-dependent methyltransferase